MAENKGKSPALHPRLGQKHQYIQVEEPHRNDIICGRGGLGMYHTGNCILRKLIASLKPTYIKSSRPEKMRIISNLVRQWPKQHPPGRFLKEETSTGLWICLGEREIKKKVGQLLREGTSTLRKQPLLVREAQKMMKNKRTPEEKVNECTMMIASSSQMRILPISQESADFRTRGSGSTTTTSSTSCCGCSLIKHDSISSSLSCSESSSAHDDADDALQKTECEFLFKPYSTISTILHYRAKTTNKKTLEPAARHADEVTSSMSTTTVPIMSQQYQTAADAFLLQAAIDYLKGQSLKTDHVGLLSDSKKIIDHNIVSTAVIPSTSTSKGVEIPPSSDSTQEQGKRSTHDFSMMSELVDLLKEPIIGSWPELS